MRQDGSTDRGRRRLLARLKADRPVAALRQAAVAHFVLRLHMGAVVQFHHGHDFAATVADHVVGALLGDAQTVGMRLLAVAGGVEQGRHCDLGKDVMVRHGRDQPAEELHFVVRHDGAALVLAMRAALLRTQQHQAGIQHERGQHDQHRYDKIGPLHGVCFQSNARTSRIASMEASKILALSPLPCSDNPRILKRRGWHTFMG